MNSKTVIILCVVSAAGSFVVTRYYFPQIETKSVEVIKEVVKTDVKTVIKTVQRPDGTTDTTTTIEDHSTKTETAKSTLTEYKAKDWHISAGTNLNLTAYALHAERRILGPLFLGAIINVKNELPRTEVSGLITVGIEF